MKFKILLTVILLIILYGVYGPTQDGRQPFPITLSDPNELHTLGIPLDRIKNVEYLTQQNDFKNPQDTSIDSVGNIYSGMGDGKIYKITPERQYQIIGKSKGPILGVTLNEKKNQLYIVDRTAGIGKLNLQTKQLQIIVSRQKYPEITSPNSITFDDNDILYFTNCGKISSQYQREILNGHPDGTIYSYDQKQKKLQILLDKITFPNGIVHNRNKNPDQQCLYVAQTSSYRVIRIYLRGQKRGKSQIVVDNLPTHCDNLKINQKGQIWLATPSIRDQYSALIDRSVILRRMLLNFRVPLSLFFSLANVSYSGGMKIDPIKGEVVDYFYGKSDDKINFITGISEHDGKLYLSSIANTYIYVVPYQ